jgi:tetratricopeptide (TPR) repeat protein
MPITYGNELKLFKKTNISQLTALAILACAVAVVYSNTINSSFHLDDERVIWNNPAIFLREINWENLERAAFESTIRTRPVAHISFAFNYYFHQLNLPGYHIFNISIHILTSIFLFLLIKATLSLPPLMQRYSPKNVFYISFLTTAIWALHPLQTQSVTYIVQRMNSMCAMFYILAMLLYVKGRLAEDRKAKWVLFSGCIISGILALGSKENGATLPFFIFLYEWYFLQDLRMPRLSNKLLWFLLGTAITIVGILTILYLGTNPAAELSQSYRKINIKLTQKLLTEARIIMLYISLLFFPLPDRLNLDHDFILSQSLFSPATTLLSIAVLAGLLLFAIIRAKKQRLISFCILWFLGNLVIESTIIPLELVFEHRTYLPSMFFLLLVVVLVSRVLSAKKYVLYAAFGVIVMLLSIWTYERNKVWADELTLWQDCLKKSPYKWRAHNNLGKEYIRLWEIDKGIFYYRKALELAPKAIKPRMNLATAYSMQKRYQEAIIELQIILNLEPDNTRALKNLNTNMQFLRQQMGR